MSDIEFDCPECGGLLVVSARGAGKTVNCTLCSKPVRIPEQTTGNASDIHFVCPHCKGSLVVPKEFMGTTVDCPSCKGRLRVPTVEATVGQNRALVTCPICHVKVKSSNLDRHVRNCQFCQQHNAERIQEDKERKHFARQYDIQAEKDRIRKMKEEEEEEDIRRKEWGRHEELMRRYNALSHSEKEELRGLEEECNFLSNRREPEFYGLEESKRADDWLRERKRQLGLDLDLPPRPPRYSGVAHRWLCWMCEAHLPATLFDRGPRDEVGVFPFLTGSLALATAIVAIVAIVKQNHSDLRTGLKSIPILVLTMIGLYASLATGYFLFHNVKTFQFDQPWVVMGDSIPLSRDSLCLTMTFYYTLCVATLGTVGFVLLRVRGRQ